MSGLLRVKFQIRPTGFLDTLLAAFDEVDRIELDNAIYVADKEWMEFVTFTGISNDKSVMKTIDTLERCNEIDSSWTTGSSTRYHLLLLVREITPFIVPTITGVHAVPLRLFVSNERLTAIVSVRDWNHLKDLAEYIETNYDDFELRGTSQIDSPGVPLGGQQLRQIARNTLTERQLHLLETGYRMGHFEVPQRATAGEVADELDLSKGALSEQLRRAEYALLDLLFGIGE